MRNFIATTALLLASGLSVYAQESNPNSAEIAFDIETINYGQIEKNADGAREFTFTNTGSEPLIIEDAKGSCGCTVPKFPKEPIKPGATGEIEVVYSPGKQQGSQNKTVTITANTEPVSTTLNILADVEVIKE